MPKKILFESAVHQFLWAASRLQARLRRSSAEEATRLGEWIRALQIKNPGAGRFRVTWTLPHPGEREIAYQTARFYTRGDTPAHREQQLAAGLISDGDRVMAANMTFFDEAIRATLVSSRLFGDAPLALEECAGPPTALERPDPAQKRKAAEETFHDEWAGSTDVSAINVRQRNEACTAPEMRHIRQALGDLNGKTLLDVGCGLGEASVYFALEGAHVTATDVSPGMCVVTQQLASANGVSLDTHVSAAEDLRLGGRQFDIIYTGNTLHHVDIAGTMERMLPHLRPDGVFVSWDPVAYNPLINIYRRLATRVRTPDEHPLRLRDIRLVASRFRAAEIRWFWLTTLSIFLLMVVVQFRNPNRERFWKSVVDEAERWSWLYRPLARLDTVLLKWIPFLRPLCWNVVIIGRNSVEKIAQPDA